MDTKNSILSSGGIHFRRSQCPYATHECFSPRSHGGAFDVFCDSGKKRATCSVSTLSRITAVSAVSFGQTLKNPKNKLLNRS